MTTVPEAEARLEGHPYGREADELINLVFDSGPSSSIRKLAVAEWLREYVAARSFGCTGLTADPDGPELRLDGPERDAPASGAEDERRDSRNRPWAAPIVLDRDDFLEDERELGGEG